MISDIPTLSQEYDDSPFNYDKFDDDEDYTSPRNSLLGQNNSYFEEDSFEKQNDKHSDNKTSQKTNFITQTSIETKL